jgi:hypothetical protein
MLFWQKERKETRKRRRKYAGNFYLNWWLQSLIDDDDVDGDGVSSPQIKYVLSIFGKELEGLVFFDQGWPIL